MNGFFYGRLALTNLSKNKSTYFPYILSCSTIVGLFFMLNSIMIFCKESEFAGAGVTTIILMLSVIIAAVISVLIIFYTNSFLIKRRKKELGLYSVLGMEKRHVARVLFWEVTITGILSLATGIIGGMIFDKLMFLVMINLLKMPYRPGIAPSILMIHSHIPDRKKRWLPYFLPCISRTFPSISSTVR